jgi:hypothetical protein
MKQDTQIDKLLDKLSLNKDNECTFNTFYLDIPVIFITHTHLKARARNSIKIFHIKKEWRKITDYLSPVTGYRLPVSGFRLPVSGWTKIFYRGHAKH